MLREGVLLIIFYAVHSSNIFFSPMGYKLTLACVNTSSCLSPDMVGEFTQRRAQLYFFDHG